MKFVTKIFQMRLLKMIQNFKKIKQHWDQRQNMIGDPLPGVVQFDNMENCILNYALGENNIPKYVLLDDDFELFAFP